ncbi:cysteine desulfurase family protein [Caryophanon latum]|uniref:Cysteine desulfurase DndA n=1 Tax=Caryophanon latum TaxID=33977 RepID=A0A1C0YJE2_9BACL|nr:cysteine desulfurase family protein [Caryophanon latum]OCS87296.1 cysteine desulfurase DndA [Caryophanon latum]
MLYLDNSATTPVHPEVKEAMLPYLLEQFGNPSSKYYDYATTAKDAVANARQAVANLLHCKTDEVIFTSGSTESNNFIIKGITDQRKDLGKHIITTATEHPSVLETCKYLQTIGFELTILPVNINGRVSVEQVRAAIRPDTILLTIQWGNNELGTLNPIAEIAELCEEQNVFLHSDATQVIGKIEFSLEDMPGLQAISISAHKYFGPKGVGVAYLKQDAYNLYPDITPLFHGGGQEYGLRSGTLAVHNIVGMGVASKIAATKLKHNIEQLTLLEKRLVELLQQQFGSNIKFNQPSTNKIPGIVSVQFIGLNNEILVKKLAPIIAVSTGSACSSAKPSHVLAAIGLSLNEVRQTIRFSLSPYIELEELNIFKEL